MELWGVHTLSVCLRWRLHVRTLHAYTNRRLARTAEASWAAAVVNITSTSMQQSGSSGARSRRRVGCLLMLRNEQPGVRLR